MVLRCIVLCAVALAALLGPRTPAASAHGPLLKGQKIDRPTAVMSTTGACVCDDRWYTLGLKPGVLQLSASLTRCGDLGSTACSIQVYLMRGHSQLRQLQASCLISAGPCNQGDSTRYRVTRKGVFYVLVRGGGGEGVHFRLSVRGPVYPLHCGKYC
jgi:hypothetical protein